MKKYLAMLAVVLMGWSCDKYDDTALKDRIEGLEDRVAKLEWQLKNLNDGYEAISNLIGQGFVTGFVENGDSYTITVKNADGTSKDYTLKKAEKGDKGDKGDTGAAGKDGSTPVFTLGGPDSEGRYWWLIDGVEAKDSRGNRVYASGIQGVTGEDGATPHLAVAAEKDGQPDFSNDDPKAELHWWVSYDWNDDDAAATWEDLGIAKGQADDVSITATYEDGVLTIFVNGEKQVSVEIGTGFELSFSIEDETVDPFSTIEFEEGETLDIQVVLGGEKADDFAVEARLQNAGSWDVYVDDDVISVTRTGDNATKLFVEVINDGKYIKTWVEVAPSPAQPVTLNFPATDSNDYLPVAYGTIPASGIGVGLSKDVDASTLAWLPEEIEVDLVLSVQKPALADMTYTFSEAEDVIPGWKLPESATIQKGNTSTIAKVVLTRSALTEGDYYGTINVEEVHGYGDGQVDLNLANNFALPYTKMTVDMFEDPYVMCLDYEKGNANEGWGTQALIDEDPNTYWASDWQDNDQSKFGDRSKMNGDYFKSNDTYKYGIWFEVTLPAEVFVIGVEYQVANSNAKPKTVVVAGGKGGTYGYANTTVNLDAKGAYDWVKLNPYYQSNVTPYDVIRFGVTYTQEASMTMNPWAGVKIAGFHLLCMY